MHSELLLTELIERKCCICFIAVDVDRLDDKHNTALHLIAKYLHELYREADIQQEEADIRQTQVVYCRKMCIAFK